MLLYHHLKEAVFLSRPNRFIAICLLDGQQVTCHVKNTGRCRELLVPGCKVWLEYSQNPSRKTPCDLVCVQSNGYIINMDSQAPNHVFAEWALSGNYLLGLSDLKPQQTWGNSRFDFSWRCGDACGFTEVKGVTLFDYEDIAYFPDAPTERGVKHLYELIAASKAGYRAALCFVIQRNMAVCLKPNAKTDADFAAALRECALSGVQLTAAVCDVTPSSMTITHTIPVITDNI